MRASDDGKLCSTLISLSIFMEVGVVGGKGVSEGVILMNMRGCPIVHSRVLQSCHLLSAAT